MSDIVERLKDACVVDPNYGKSVNLTLDYDDYMEAADTITALEARVRELEGLLHEHLALGSTPDAGGCDYKCDPCDCGRKSWIERHQGLVDRTRAALSPAVRKGT